MSTVRPTTSSRPSTSGKPAPPPLTAHPTSLLHPSCTLTGTYPITLSAHSIVQLRSRLFTTHAPLTIAEGAIISERCQIGYQSAPPPPSSSPSSSSTPAKEEEGNEDEDERNQSASCTIGRHVIIESSAVIESHSIGAYAIIGAGARLGKGSVIGDGAKICPLVRIGEGEVVRPGEVVWGSGSVGERRVDEGMMGRGRDGVRIRKEAVEGLGEVYRRGWTGK